MIDTICRMWVAVYFLGSTWIADMLSWNPIQAVSCCVSPGLYLKGWYAIINSIQRVSCWMHPGSSLNCWYAFTKFYPGCESLNISRALFELLICFHQTPSRLWVTVLSRLCLNCWHVSMKPHPGCELFYAPSGLHLSCWHASMNFHPGCESLGSF